MPPTIDNSVLCLAAVTISGPRETTPAGSVSSETQDTDISCEATKFTGESPSRETPWCKDSPNSNIQKQMRKQVKAKKQKKQASKNHTEREKEPLRGTAD